MAKPNPVFKILKIFAIVIISLLIVLISIPFLFKGKIENMVKETLNKSLEAEVNFSGTSISLIRSFPDLELTVKDLTVTGEDLFEGIELFRAESVRLSFDLISLIKDQNDIELKSFHLFGADIQVVVMPGGEANYDIYKSSDTDTVIQQTSSDFRINLRDYSIRNSNIHYVDLQGGINLLLKQFNHSGKGDYDGRTANFNTSTVIDSLTFDYEGIRYLNAATISQDGNFKLELDSSKYYFNHQDFKLNTLLLDFDGWVHLDDDDIHMDINTKNKGNDFSQIMSLIPGIYSDKFSDITSSGSLTFEADVSGTYNGDKEIYPLFGFLLQIDNGAFKYAAMPESLKEVYAHIKINNPTSDLKELTVDVSRFNFNLAGELFESSFHLSQLLGNMNVISSLKGGVNLTKVAAFYPFEDMKNLRGIFRIDGDFRFRLDDVYAGNYGEITAKGEASLNDFSVEYRQYPTVSVDRTIVLFSPPKLSVPQTSILFGETDFTGEIEIENYLAYLGSEGKINGRIKTYSKTVNIDELMNMMSTEESAVVSASTELPFDRFNLDINTGIGKIIYTGYDIKNLEFNGSVNPQNIEVSKFNMVLNGNSLNIDGRMNNIYGYLFNNEVLEGIVNIKSPFIDLDSFYDESAAEPEVGEDISEEGIIQVPSEFKMVLNASVNRLKYGEIILNNVKGAIVVNNREAALENMTAEGLGGRIKLNGLYKTPQGGKPAFRFEYELSSIEFRSAFNSVNTFRQLAPVAENINGRFNSTMSLEGDLKNNMYPDLTTLSAKGFLQTINAVINQFEPLNAIGQKLNTNVFSSIRLKDSKNWFEIKDGKVNLSPFDFEFSDIKMVVSGNHSLAQDIDYKIKADVPRELLEKSQLGSSVNTGISWLANEASKQGLNIAQGDNILMDIFLGGKVNAPTVRVVPTGFSDSKKQIRDQIQGRAEEEITKLKDNLTEKAKEESEKIVNETKEKIKKETDELAQKAKKDLEDKMKEKIDNSKVEDMKDEAKEKLKKLNPFKKN